MHPTHHIAVYNHHPLYQTKINTFIEQTPAASNVFFEQLPNPILHTPSISGVNLVHEIIPHMQRMKPKAILHRNEHGLLHCTPGWNQVVEYCLSNDIVPLSFDFGYFDHYKHFMVDYYQHNCVSSIYKEWVNNSLSTTVEWSKSLPSIQEHRQKVLLAIDDAKNESKIKQLRGQKYAVIWTQWTTDLIRHCFYENNKPIQMHKWVTMLVERIRAAGLVPVIKTSPVKVIRPFEKLQHEALCLVGKKTHVYDLPAAKFVRNANANLIAHAERHFICCSSVSNELVLADANVTSMGRSWFDNLGIFHEPKTWDEVMNYQQPNQNNINMWINWWLSRQCLKENIHEKVIEICNKAKQ